MIDQKIAALEALGHLETHLHRLDNLAERLARVPLWQPSHRLLRQIREARHMINDMQTRMDRRLVVTLIGPSGAGKSTLLNALAGVDELSTTGGSRPTTKNLVVLSNDEDAAHQLLGTGPDDPVRIQSSHRAELLSHMILVDTPDTDSTQNDAHRPLIERAAARSDILICVFDAQNPKRRDHIDFMAPIVQRFHGASLVAVVNQCDRQSEEELTHAIGPEFNDFLNDAWDTRPEAVLLISARRHLQNPQWSQQAMPRHDLDQFDQLRELIFSTFNKPGFAPDRRVANARQICDFVQDQVSRAVAVNATALAEAAEKCKAAENQALHSAVETLRARDQRMALGVHVRLYQVLAQQWMGPVGWLVAIWSRLTIFGSGLAALVRFGNPLRQIWGLVSSWRRYKESSAALASLDDQTRVDSAMQAFQRTMWTLWPDIAERLIRGGFDPQVRRTEADSNTEVGALVQTLWADTLDTQISQTAGKLSHFLLQLLFNLPSLALLGYVGWLTASRFLAGTYMNTDFFLHALLAIAVVLLLSFFLLQMIVRLATGQDRIQRRAFQKVEQTISNHQVRIGKDVAEQVAAVLSLE